MRLNNFKSHDSVKLELVLQEKALTFDLQGNNYLSVKKAYSAALINANQGDTIYVGGSTFVVAEII